MAADNNYTGDDKSYLQSLKEKYNEMRTEISLKREELRDEKARKDLEKQEQKLQDIFDRIESSNEGQIENLRRQASHAWDKLQNTWNNVIEKAKI